MNFYVLPQARDKNYLHFCKCCMDRCRAHFDCNYGVQRGDGLLKWLEFKVFVRKDPESTYKTRDIIESS